MMVAIAAVSRPGGPIDPGIPCDLLSACGESEEPSGHGQLDKPGRPQSAISHRRWRFAETSPRPAVTGKKCGKIGFHDTPPFNVRPTPMNQGPLDLREYLSIIWGRKWILVAVLATTTVAALFYSYRQTPLYTTSSEVVVRPARFDPKQPSAAAGFLNMQTEVQVANSSAVAELARENLADEGVRPGGVSATQVEDAEAIAFASTSPDPEASRAAADAYADAYLTIRRSQVVKELEEARRPYETRIAEIDTELSQIARTLETLGESVRSSVLTTRYSALLSERSGLTLQLGDLGEPENIQVGEVLRTAKLPDSPSSPNHIRDGGIGFVVGLALGIGVAFFRDRLDDRPRGRDDLELQSGAPVLAFIPKTHSRNPAPITLVEPESEATEAYRALRVRLLHLAGQQKFKTLVITSALAGEGKTSTTANVGVTLAMVGKRVVMISADLRRPRLQTYFPAKDGLVGLTQILTSEHYPLEEALSDTGVQNLWLLQSGPQIDSPGPLELLSSESMIDLIAELRSVADFVLIDTPPLMVSSDVAALAPMIDGVLFVADPRQVQRPVLEQARRELQLMDVPLVGVIVNRHDPRRFRSYGSGYGYYAEGPPQQGRQHPAHGVTDADGFDSGGRVGYRELKAGGATEASQSWANDQPSHRRVTPPPRRKSSREAGSSAREADR
jgi:polysaccharide biosynthesis transport protein